MTDRRDGPPFFGEPWPSGICDTGVQVSTPVGEPCVNCTELIEDGDQGSFTYMLDMEFGVVDMKPQHKECALRAVVGGIAHVTKDPSCPCQGGDDPDMGLSYRDSALLVWEWTQAHGRYVP